MSNSIGSSVTLHISSFGKELEAKVDTGATLCCLHGDNISVNKATKTVSFSNPDISSNIIRAPLCGEITVSSADGGSDDRPTILLDVEMNGIALKNIEFNINDRSNMNSKVLIGQNLLKAGDFVVDVNNSTTESVKVGVDTGELEMVVTEPDTSDIAVVDGTSTSFDISGKLTMNETTEEVTVTFTLTKEAMLNVLNASK